MRLSANLRLAITFFFGMVMFATTSATVSGEEQPTLILATIEGSDGVRIRSENGQLISDNPGYYPLLAAKAADICGAKVEFKFMPWKRALESVKAGRVSAAFASSFKEERAVYGVYPRINGTLDPSRAQRVYAYHFYAKKNRPEAKEGWRKTIGDALVGVERDASIIPMLKELGAKPYENSQYDILLKMLVNGRFPFVVGIADNFDPVVKADETLSAQVVRLEPALEVRTGYVMFGKAFYEANRNLVECFWDESARISKTQWYRDVVRQHYSQ
ncbi:hypothetical protein EOI86_06335 [Hwanghaeella grinnelliae]|uniref:Transporter substrate-binding domain-containing protein n=1 Tax=Hwanghaeella grinnelliae TaxID=2500179 RepID=A0A437QWH4_9PROT|nr:hypothetical protein [Hwanghaeella grinnelliae]RVU38880.1 hypothetical protein EOI86_06335 [Hwanghaeella grinnelliae]